VLNENGDAAMIDFESRGVGIFASAPEINYLEYIFSLATDNVEEHSQSEKFKRLYEKMIHGHEVSPLREQYQNPEHGFCVPWLCLSEREREAAEVYMLGRVFWCIFEGIGSPERGSLVEHIREDSLEFPQWKNATREAREMVQFCCGVNEGHQNFPLTRVGKRFVLRDSNSGGTEDETCEVAAKWWEVELRRAEEFLENRLRSGPNKSMYGRPTLDKVLLKLQTLGTST